MSVDPIVEDVHDAQTWNPYSYVSNRPLTLVDPTGLGGVDDDGGGSVDPDVAADEDPVDWQGGCTGGRNSEDGACVKLVGPPETEIADSSAGVFDNGPPGGYWSGDRLGTREPPLPTGSISGRFNGIAALDSGRADLNPDAPCSGASADIKKAVEPGLERTRAKETTNRHVQETIDNSPTRPIGEASAWLTEQVLMAGALSVVAMELQGLSVAARGTALVDDAAGAASKVCFCGRDAGPDARWACANREHRRGGPRVGAPR